MKSLGIYKVYVTDVSKYYNAGYGAWIRIYYVLC